MQDLSLHRIASVIENTLSLLYMGFPCGSAGKESACNAGDLGSIPGLGRSPGEGKGYPLQYSALENSMDCRIPWGRKESDTTERLSLHFIIIHTHVYTRSPCFPFRKVYVIEFIPMPVSKVQTCASTLNRDCIIL